MANSSISSSEVLTNAAEILAKLNISAGSATIPCRVTVDGQEMTLPNMTQTDCEQIPQNGTTHAVIKALYTLISARRKAAGDVTGSCTFTIDGQAQCIPDVTQDDCTALSDGTGEFVAGGTCDANTW